MNVNLSSRELLDSYNRILSGDPEVDWTIFTYAQGSNDLKVQASGDGGLEEVADEFRDGRMQYAFVRVTDPNSELPKFVQINWCGDGVPETKKGLFHSHSATVAAFLKASHIQINARNETDVEPEVILKKLTDSGGAKYSIQQKNAPAQPRDKIAPVGSSYTPVGKVDMGALKSSKPTQSYTPPPPGASFARPTPAPAAAATQAKTFTPPPVKKFTPPVLPPQATARNDDDEADETWGDEPPAPPAPATTPSVPAPKASAPAGSFYKAPTIAPAPAKVEVKAESEKPKEVDRIGKVGTAYTPVELPKPKKLVNPFAAAQAQQSTPAPSSAPSSGGAAGAGGGAKLTWSQRQALAKERDAADEARSSQASAAVSRGPLGGVSAAAVGAGVGVALAGEGHGESPDHEETPAPAAPPRPLFTTRPGPPPAPTAAAADEPDNEGFEEPSPPSSPPPPPKRAIVANAPPAFPDDEDDFDEPEPTPAPRKVVANAAPAFPDDDDFEEDEPAPPPPAARIPPPAPRAPTPEPETEPEPEPAPAPAPERSSNAISGLRAKVLFDYEKTEDNELQLVEGEILTEVDMIDEGWWSAINSAGESGLFPSNYTEIIEAEEEEAAPAPTPAPPPPPPRPATPEPEPEPEVTTGGLIAVAAYEYDAGEDNEISFKEGDRIVNIEQDTDDWWTGDAPDGSRGLFPAAYVEIQQ